MPMLIHLFRLYARTDSKVYVRTFANMLIHLQVLERVKRAEAESLLKAAQGKVQRVENMVAYLRNALILGGRGCLLLQETV